MLHYHLPGLLHFASFILPTSPIYSLFATQNVIAMFKYVYKSFTQNSPMALHFNEIYTLPFSLSFRTYFQLLSSQHVLLQTSWFPRS